MKHIIKCSEPQAFADWKDQANEDWQPDYDDLSGAPKEAVKEALMKEQGYLCCYCERRLTDDDSHIEHLRPQSDPAVDPLDFANMLCSCQNHSRTCDRPSFLPNVVVVTTLTMRRRPSASSAVRPFRRS